VLCGVCGQFAIWLLDHRELEHENGKGCGESDLTVLDANECIVRGPETPNGPQAGNPHLTQKEAPGQVEQASARDEVPLGERCAFVLALRPQRRPLPALPPLGVDVVGGWVS